MARKILYITLPAELAEQTGDFNLDSALPLPVEIPEGEEESWDISKLTWPSIISGMLHLLRTDPRAAESDYYRRLVKAVRPDIVNTVLTAAQLKTDGEDFPFAEELFLTLCALEPEEKTHRKNLALFYKKREEFRLKDNENYTRALQLIKEKNWDEGIPAIRAFLSAHRDSSNGWFLLGWALRQNEEWDDAYDAFLNARELSPPTAELLNEMALCESEKGEWDKARELIEEGLELEGDNTTLLSNLAMVYMQLNDLSRADDILNRLREIDPDDPLADQFLN